MRLIQPQNKGKKREMDWETNKTKVNVARQMITSTYNFIILIASFRSNYVKRLTA